MSWKDNLRNRVGSDRQQDNATHNREAEKASRQANARREKRLQEILDESGYFDQLRSVDDRHAIHRAALATVQREYREAEQRERDERQAEILQRHLEASSDVSPVKNLRDLVNRAAQKRAE